MDRLAYARAARLHPTASEDAGDRGLALETLRRSCPLLFERSDVVLGEADEAATYVVDRCETPPTPAERILFLSDLLVLLRPAPIAAISEVEPDSLAAHPLVVAIRALSDLCAWLTPGRTKRDVAAAHKVRFFVAVIRRTSSDRGKAIQLVLYDAQAEAALDAKAERPERPALVVEEGTDVKTAVTAPASVKRPLIEEIVS